MQACPCVRLRLWRQFGRDWQQARTQSPTCRAGDARRMSQAARWGAPPEVSETPPPPRRHHRPSAPRSRASGRPADDRLLNPSFYGPEDSAFWAAYDAIWGAEDGGSAAGGLQAAGSKPALTLSRDGSWRPSWLKEAAGREDSTRHASPRSRKQARPQSAERQPKPRINPREKHREFIRQRDYLKRTTPPEDFPMASSAFWKWKDSLADTWQMLVASQLPHEASESRLLRSLLESQASDANGGGSGQPGVEGIRQAWQALRPQRRRNAWPDMMVSALRSHPDQAVDIFTATYDAALVPSYLVEDTLLYLARQRATAAGGGSACATTTAAGPSRDLGSLFTFVLQNSPQDHVRLRQSALFLVLQSIQSPEAVGSLYRLLVECRHPLHKNTRLQIAHRLAKSAAHKTLALEVLQTAVAEADLDINSVQGMALCTAILSGGSSGSGEHGAAASTPAEMFEDLLRCGLEPNLITYTTIIRGLCLKQELGAAQEVLQLMEKTQTEPDAYVYSIMMNGAKLCGDVSTIQQVATSAAAQGIRHPFVWNDFLQALYMTAFAEARSDPGNKRPRVVPAFPLMVQAYAKMFEMAPLRTMLPEAGRLLGQHGGGADGGASGAEAAAAAGDAGAGDTAGAGGRDPGWPPATGSHRAAAAAAAAHQRWAFSAQLAPTVRSLRQLPAAEQIEPTSATLATMVLGYVQGLSNPYDVIAFYSHFRRLLQADNPTAMRIVRGQGTLVHDIVIMALCESEGMLRVALDVVGDMLRDASAGAEPASEAGAAEAAVARGQHPPPSVYTWSILLNGFMFHQQTKQGERILNMMSERGIQPNQVTWNTLLAGYARIQNVKKTAHTLQRQERAGFEPDEFTFRAFSYLGDKASVLRYLETQRKAKPKGAAGAAAAAAAGQPPADTLRPSATAYAGVEAEDAAAPAAERTVEADDTSTSAPLGAPIAAAPRPPSRPSPGLSSHRHSNMASELRKLENEVEEIAKMMDKEEELDSEGSGL